MNVLRMHAGLQRRAEDRLARFLLHLRWYEDLHVIEGVDGRQLEGTQFLRGGEVAVPDVHPRRGVSGTTP